MIDGAAMRLEYQILTAFLLDLLLGDPRWLPHPVRCIGAFALALENPLRRIVLNPRVAGIVTVLVVVGGTGMSAGSLLYLAGKLHPAAGDAVAVLLLYTSFACRDLIRHSHRVYAALRNNNLSEARRYVAMMVGRDTHRLDESGVIRAGVESVAENIVDGITAPLFFAALFGPVGALAYKAVSTLDSTFGYKDVRYLRFGWAAARLDDAVNYVPARLTVPLISIASAFLGFFPGRAIRICVRDGRAHASPNAGLSEAAVAGALGVQLGGVNHYGGEPVATPYLGDATRPLRRRDLLRVNALALSSSILCLLLLIAARTILTRT
jgi:adenosylcobinamide-phosphate synthase